MSKIQSELERCLANSDINRYLFGENSYTTVRHEAWMKTNCLATLALNESVKELVSILKPKDAEQGEGAKEEPKAGKPGRPAKAKK